MRKIRKKEPIVEDILETLAEEIDSHVDRATKIIVHMRQFGRKSDMARESVRVDRIVDRALEIFRQQLKARGISVSWNRPEGLPLHASPFPWPPGNPARRAPPILRQMNFGSNRLFSKR